MRAMPKNLRRAPMALFILTLEKNGTHCDMLLDGFERFDDTRAIETTTKK